MLCKNGVTEQTRSSRVALLWQLAWNDDQVSCGVYRRGPGFELRLVSGRTVLIREPFAVQPRLLARAQTLRRSMKRRGWKEV